MNTKQHMILFCLLLVSIAAKRSSRCKGKARYYQYGKCYRKSQLIRPSRDTKSKTLHAFIVSGTVENGNTITASHFSALRLQAHLYHAIVEFQFKKRKCADVVRNAHARIKNQGFLVIQYNKTSIKLVDLLMGRKRKGFQADIGYAVKMPIDADFITSCEMRVKRIIDMRRFSTLDSFPIFAQYLMFATKENKIFLSHIATTCKDYQQILSIENISSKISKRDLRRGVVVSIPSIPGQIIPVRGQILNPVTGKSRKFAAFHIGARMCGVSFHFTLKAMVFYDAFVTNMGCPK